MDDDHVQVDVLLAEQPPQRQLDVCSSLRAGMIAPTFGKELSWMSYSGPTNPISCKFERNSIHIKVVSNPAAKESMSNDCDHMMANLYVRIRVFYLEFDVSFGTG